MIAYRIHLTTGDSFIIRSAKSLQEFQIQARELYGHYLLMVTEDTVSMDKPKTTFVSDKH